MTSIRIENNTHALLLRIKKATGGRPLVRLIDEAVIILEDKYLKKSKENK